MEFQAAARRAARRYDQHVLEQMMQMPELAPAEREDATRLAQWARSSRACSTAAAGRAHVSSRAAALVRPRT